MFSPWLSIVSLQTKYTTASSKHLQGGFNFALTFCPESLVFDKSLKCNRLFKSLECGCLHSYWHFVVCWLGISGSRVHTWNMLTVWRRQNNWSVAMIQKYGSYPFSVCLASHFTNGLWCRFFLFIRSPWNVSCALSLLVSSCLQIPFPHKQFINLFLYILLRLLFLKLHCNGLLVKTVR